MAIKKIISEIKVNKGSLREVERILGSASARKVKNRFVTPKVKKLANLSQDALKSTIPIDTKELRNTFVVKDYIDDTHVRVGIAPGTHYGRDRIPRNAARLANLLDKNGIFKRSKRSLSSGPFSISIAQGSPTAQWIDKALKVFKEERRRNITSGR